MTGIFSTMEHAQTLTFAYESAETQIPRLRYTRSKNIPKKSPLNCRSLRFAPPDFLLNLVALVDFMRLSPTERRTRGLVQCCVAGNPGTLRSG
jgi:hypothetical protein